MRKLSLAGVTAICYAAFIIWDISGGVTGNELLFSLIALYIFPAAVTLIAAAGIRRSRMNLIPLTMILCGQLLLPLLVFKTFQAGPLIVFAATLAAGLAASRIIPEGKTQD